MLKNRVRSPVVKPIILDSYLAMIRNGVGANMFRSVYAEVDGKRKDVLYDGVLSCAFFVSSVLVIFGLTKRSHATVDGTVRDLEESGWRRIRKPKPGAVLVWEMRRYQDGSRHRHIGFYVGHGRAVSNDTPTRVLIEHHWKYRGERELDSIWWHRKLYKR